MDTDTGLSLKEISALINENASNIASTFRNLTSLRNTVRQTQKPNDRQISTWYNRVRDFRFSLSGIKYRLEEVENGLKGLPGVCAQDVGKTSDIYPTLNHGGQRVNMLHSWGGQTSVNVTSEATTLKDVSTQETKSELYQKLAQQKNSAQLIEQGINQFENEIWDKRRQSNEKKGEDFKRSDTRSQGN